MMQISPVSRCPSPPPYRTRVVLVRHGRSTLNEQGRYQGSSNESVLTLKGWQTAEQTGKGLRDFKFDAIYSSPLQRVQETVAAIQQGMSQGTSQGAINSLYLPLYTDPALREIDIPDWEGLAFSEVRQRFAIDYQCWKQRPHQFRMQHAAGNEFFPVLDLYERAAQFWQTVLPRHRGQTLLIVAHGGTNHALLSTAIGLAPQHHHTLQQSNCGISVLDFSETKPPQLRSLNSTSHLNETLPKLKEGKQGLRLLLLPLDPATSYPNASIQQLAHQLQPAAIDLSVSARLPQAKQAIEQVLSHHPRTVRFETLKTDFLQDWQQTIARRTADADHLITGLAVADMQQIQRLIANAIGLSANQMPSIQLEPGHLSILHYSKINHPPVLQSLNFNFQSFISSRQEIYS